MSKSGNSTGSKFRRSFVTGLLVLAPVWITVYLVILVVRVLGGFLSPYLRELAAFMLGEGRFSQLVVIGVDVVAFLITVLLIALFGAIIRRVVGQRLFRVLERLLGKIPVVRDVYDAIRNLTQMLFGEKRGFQKVVAVRVSSVSTWRIGFVTNEVEWKEFKDSPKLLSIFVPVTPNATSGFLVFAPPDDVVELAIPVEQAVKMIISAGTLGPE